MPFALTVTKVTVDGADDIPAERVDRMARQLALEIRNAVHLIEVQNCDVKIHMDGLVVTEAEVRASAATPRPKKEDAA